MVIKALLMLNRVDSRSNERMHLYGLMQYIDMPDSRSFPMTSHMLLFPRVFH